jgi:hypothetical protein
MARYALDLVVSQARCDNYCRLYISCWYYLHWLVSKLRMWVVAQTLDKALRRLASSKLTGMDIAVTTARLRICGEWLGEASPHILKLGKQIYPLPRRESPCQKV